MEEVFGEEGCVLVVVCNVEDRDEVFDDEDILETV